MRKLLKKWGDFVGFFFMKTKDGLDSLLYKNWLGAVLTRDNSAGFRDGEFEITGRKLRAQLSPKKNPPMKHKVKKVKK